MSKNIFSTIASSFSSPYASDSSPLPVECTLSLLHKYLIQEPSLSQVCGGLVAAFLSVRTDAVVASRDAAAIVSCTTRGIVASPSVPLAGDCTAIASTGNHIIATRGEGIAVLSSSLSLERELIQPGHHVLCVAVSPDGEHFATGGTDAAVAVWSLDEGQVRYFSGHGDWVRFIAFIVVNDCLLIVTAGDDGCACLWDLKEGHIATLEFSAGGSSIRAFDVSSDGILAIANEVPALSIYTVGNDQFNLSGIIQRSHAGTLTACKVVSSLRLVVSAAEDEVIAVSCLNTFQTLWKCNALVTRRRCISFMNTVTCIRILDAPPTSSAIVILVCASDGTLLQWVIDPRDQRSSYTRTLQLHIGALIGLDPIAH